MTKNGYQDSVNYRYNYIYPAIDRERRYQDWKTGYAEASEFDINPPGQHDIAGWIDLMQDYLDLAKEGMIFTSEDQDRKLHNIRKVVALGIACFEQYGIPERVF